MAAPVIAVERFRVEHGDGFSMPVVSLTDRRAAGNRLVRFVFQCHIETVLYGRSEGSSGPIWKVMNTAGIGATTLVVNKAAVTTGTITEDEYAGLMDTFKSALPADVVDPCSLGRIRNCTILPRCRCDGCPHLWTIWCVDGMAARTLSAHSPSVGAARGARGQ